MEILVDSLIWEHFKTKNHSIAATNLEDLWKSIVNKLRNVSGNFEQRYWDVQNYKLYKHCDKIFINSLDKLKSDWVLKDLMLLQK